MDQFFTEYLVIVFDGRYKQYVGIYYKMAKSRKNCKGGTKRRRTRSKRGGVWWDPRTWGSSKEPMAPPATGQPSGVTIDPKSPIDPIENSQQGQLGPPKQPGQIGGKKRGSRIGRRRRGH